jgi:crossover junction endodeoxyribonuclease RuvC
MGIDPASIRNLGVGIVVADIDNRSFDVKLHTTVVLPDFKTDAARLKYIYGQIEDVIKEYNPTILAIELSMGFGKSFVRKNLQESVGVIKLCCENYGIQVVEEAPTHMKLVIAGSGKASKTDMKQWIKIATKLEKPKTEHEADAVATALTFMIDEDYIDPIHEKK